MSYMNIWKPAQRRATPEPTVRGRRLPRRVKDWPKDAATDFKRVKNELWKWVKKENIPHRGGLALIAYKAVKEEYERTEVDLGTINCETEEELWEKLSELTSRS